MGTAKNETKTHVCALLPGSTKLWPRSDLSFFFGGGLNLNVFNKASFQKKKDTSEFEVRIWINICKPQIICMYIIITIRH